MTERNTGRVRPIRPREVDKAKQFPDEALEAFNELIAENYRDGSARVGQDKVVALMVKKGLKKKEIFDRGWLDVEGIYRAAGWEVNYDKPGWDETYEANFTFTPAR